MKAKKEHQIAFERLTALVKEMADQHQLTSLETFAVASNMLGKLMALLDQRYVSADRAKAVMVENIQAGNRQAIAEIMNSKGNA